MGKRVQIILVPFHAGDPDVTVGAGPFRIMEDGLAGALHTAGIETSCWTIEGPAEGFEGEIGRTFEIKRRVARAVADARASEAFPLIVAGNCNTTVGVAAGLNNPDLGVIWFDAHADFDTPDEHVSGYFDGMGAATLTGQCWRRLAASIDGFKPVPEDHLVFCGIRDLSKDQSAKVRSSDVRAVFGQKDSEPQPASYSGSLQAQLQMVPFQTALIHLDVDCLDTSVGIANQYACSGGLSTKDLLACLDVACAAVTPAALTTASFDPSFDGAENISKAAIAAAVKVASEALEYR